MKSETGLPIDKIIAKAIEDGFEGHRMADLEYFLNQEKIDKEKHNNKNHNGVMDNHEVIEKTPKDLPAYKVEKNTKLVDKEWKTIEEIREEMEKSNDKRHLYYLPKDTFVSSKPSWSKGNFFSGKLNQNVLGVIDEEDEGYLRLRPLDSTLKNISISFFIENLGEMHKKELPINPKTKRHKGCIDLNKIKTKEQFVEKIFKN